MKREPLDLTSKIRYDINILTKYMYSLEIFNKFVVTLKPNDFHL